MIYTTEVPDIDKEEHWTDFIQTGSVASYLKYKGIVAETDKEANGWHSSIQTESSQKKLNMATPPEF